MKNLPTYKQYINEGRYDKLTGDITDAVWKFIHTTKKLYDANPEENKVYSKDIEGFESDPKANLMFDIQFVIKRDESSQNTCYVDGSAANDEDFPSEISILLFINPKTEPQVYSILNGKIQDTIRHEIEHLTQSGDNIRDFKPKPVSDKILAKVNNIPKEEYKYFTLRDEIPAMVHGLYRKAKVEKKPLDVVMLDYLESFKNDKILDNKKIENIMKKWIDFAKQNLPSAQYKNPKYAS